MIPKMYNSYIATLTPGWHLLSGINKKVRPKSVPENCIKVIYEYSKEKGSYFRVEAIDANAGIFVKVDKNFEKCDFILSP